MLGTCEPVGGGVGSGWRTQLSAWGTSWRTEREHCKNGGQQVQSHSATRRQLTLQAICIPLFLLIYFILYNVFRYLFYLHMTILPICLYIHRKVLDPQKWMTVRHHVGAGDQNPGPLKEERVLLTVKPPLSIFFFLK